MSTTPSVRFNKKDKPEFFRALQSKVHQYFEEKQVSRFANGQMIFKTAFMMAVYFIPLGVLLYGAMDSLAIMFAMWIIMGIGMSGLGLAVMHDANHGAYSSKAWVNKMVGGILIFIGGYHINWIIQHNVLHHSFTNVHEHDEDIGKGVMRFSPDQDQKPIFKFQAFYAPFLYAIMTLYWMSAKDYQQAFRYQAKNLLAAQGLTLTKALVYITLTKIIYVVVTLVLPLVLLPFTWYQIVLGFVFMHFICGLILALIFQPAHVIEETKFFKVDDRGSIENSWAILQMETTANFANKSRFFSWFVGGLNYQIEHHLFPHICHVHYRPLSKIVKETAKEYGVPYHEHETFYDAVKSHFVLLHKLGTGTHERDFQAQ